MRIETNAGAVDDDIEDDLGSMEEVPKRIEKCFSDIIYDQGMVDPYGCTVVATYTALSNLENVVVPYKTMRATVERMKKDGKFRPGFGAKLSDGVKYALDDFNREYGKNLKSNMIYVSALSLLNALKVSPVVSGIYYGKKFVEDTQDNAWIDGAIEGVKGTQGHAIAYVKINTERDHLVKFCNSYAGRLSKNVVGFDINKYRAMCFNSGFYFTK